MTPCERRPDVFELLSHRGVRPSVDQIEGAQYACVRWCARLAECRADRGAAQPEHVWAGLLVDEHGQTYETVEEWHDRSPTKRAARVRKARHEQTKLVRHTHCLARGCDKALTGDQRMYCCKTHARRACASRHAVVIDVDVQVHQLLARTVSWRDVSTAARRAVVTQLNAEGEPDAVIARRLRDVSRDAVYNIRYRELSLPPVPAA